MEQLLHGLKGRLKRLITYDRSINLEVNSINLHRLNYLVLVMFLVHVAHLLIFWLYIPVVSENAHKWRNGIIFAHSSMLVVVSILGAVSYFIVRRKKTASRLAAIFQGVVIQSYQHVDNEIARMRRTGKEACVIMMDIDHFKKINDTYGHPAGDSILKDISQMVSSLLRKTDIFARLGGEEFIILLPETSMPDGAKLAGKLCAAFQAATFSLGAEVLKVTVSFGVACLTGYEMEPFNASYSEADKALYRAKKNGRNRVEIACANEEQPA